jgi:hypothetical protein
VFSITLWHRVLYIKSSAGKLKKLTGATDGNLGAHIETLARAGYVRVDKAFVGKKPQTTVSASAAGRGAFARHVATLQEIIAGGEGET